MKKSIFLFFILGGLFFSSSVFAQEKINNFEVEIKINSDAGIGDGSGFGGGGFSGGGFGGGGGGSW